MSDLGEVFFLHKNMSEGGHVQTIIFDKTIPVTKQKAWLKKHGFDTQEADQKTSTVRYRQEEPSKFRKGTFKTYEVGDGIKIVSGKLKKIKA